MYKLKDISVVIATYNRPEELKITLKALKFHLKYIKEAIIVDQSLGEKTRKVVSSFKLKNLIYVYSPVPSITRARNIGVKKSSKETKIVSFIDDDVSLKKSYFKEILKIYNSNKEARAVAGYVPYEKNMPNPSKFELLARKIFFLGGRLYKNDASIVSSYGNRYPISITKVINADWMPGDNMSYRKEIVEELKFDENLLGYTVAEDIDMGYRLSRKYKNSIFITPYAGLIHRYSFQERSPTAKASYLNQVDHFYFFFKNLNKNIVEKLIFIWSLLGITILRTCLLLIKPSKASYLKLKYYFISLFYCISNLDKIKSGRVREFPA